MRATIRVPKAHPEPSDVGIDSGRERPAGNPTVPSVVVIRTIHINVAIEPAAEADTDSYSHHILVELAENNVEEDGFWTRCEG